ncbi:hypothetical protein QTP86_015321 [Hemibagrus guttatus]|nr:hypothetical protein QTP86_015321 [Hemibagrus guttatus]
MGKCEDLSEFGKGQIVMTRRQRLEHLQNCGSCGVFPVCSAEQWKIGDDWMIGGVLWGGLMRAGNGIDRTGCSHSPGAEKCLMCLAHLPTTQHHGTTHIV